MSPGIAASRTPVRPAPSGRTLHRLRRVGQANVRYRVDCGAILLNEIDSATTDPTIVTCSPCRFGTVTRRRQAEEGTTESPPEALSALVEWIDWIRPEEYTGVQGAFWAVHDSDQMRSAREATERQSND